MVLPRFDLRLGSWASTMKIFMKEGFNRWSELSYRTLFSTGPNDFQPAKPVPRHLEPRPFQLYRLVLLCYTCMLPAFSFHLPGPRHLVHAGTTYMGTFLSISFKPPPQKRNICRVHPLPALRSLCCCSDRQDRSVSLGDPSFRREWISGRNAQMAVQRGSATDFLWDESPKWVRVLIVSGVSVFCFIQTVFGPGRRTDTPSNPFHLRPS